MTDAVYQKVLNQPDNIPFYVHGANSDERVGDVLDFVRSNGLSIPYFKQ